MARVTSLSDLSRNQLADNIRRYRERSAITGGHFTLSELLQEQLRRKKTGVLPTVAAAHSIVQLASTSSTGLTTYSALWEALRPGEPWKLFPCRSEIINVLERVQHYCVRHQLPLLATLVVNKGAGQLTEEAKANIAAWAREHGLAVGPAPSAFVAQEQQKARRIDLQALPPSQDAD